MSVCGARPSPWRKRLRRWSTAAHTAPALHLPPAARRLVAMTYDEVTYYYVTNLQGDVVGLLDEDGNKMISYRYTAYGQCFIFSDESPMTMTLANMNPLGYRGYVMDVGTFLYYCQSRYYDQTVGRFINADGFVATGQGLTGNNMFAYCLNNPVRYVDKTGNTADDPAGMAGQAIAEWLYELITGQSHPNHQTRALEAQVAAEQGKMMVKAGKAVWDAYQSSYEREQEAVTNQAKANISVFDSVEDCWQSLKIIMEVNSFAVACYKTAAIATAAGQINVGAIFLGVGSIALAFVLLLDEVMSVS